jgi:O-methyltransferase
MIKAGIQRLLNSMGFDLVRNATNFSQHELQTMQKVKSLTATSKGRMVGLMDAVKYVVANKIDGAFIECGVWRGGSSMVAAYTLLELG